MTTDADAARRFPQTVACANGTVLEKVHANGHGAIETADYEIILGGAPIGILTASAASTRTSCDGVHDLRARSHAHASRTAFARDGAPRDGGSAPALHLHLEEVAVHTAHRGSRASLEAIAALCAAMALRHGPTLATLCADANDPAIELRLATHYARIGFSRIDVTAAIIDDHVHGGQRPHMDALGPEDGTWMARRFAA